jgi:hypothetical protein
MVKWWQCEDTTRVIRSCKSKDRQCNCQMIAVLQLSVLRLTASDYPCGIFTLLSFYHCIVRPSIYSFWLPLWYLHTAIILPLHCMAFDLQLLITLVVSSHRYHLTITLSVLRFTASDYPCGIFTLLSFDHCIVCPSINSFWFPLWYLHTAIILPLHCPSFDLELLITVNRRTENRKDKW